ncbi:MAG: biotin--[acetyl-CoA-carboxylase] ligase, partial [Verrucomicrobia bacterium]|nr:biotin--[acetyl-CoA-carboxylase] ligase [Verrucomicrobiota bacterium]
ETQTAGHGRQGKAWISEKPLGLWVSLLLETSPSHLPLLSLLGSLAAADAVRTLTRLEPSLKWPNDLLLQNRKLAGLLVETVSRKNQPPLALLGLGLNLHHQASDFPTSLEKTAISLFQASGQLIPRAQMLAAFLNSLACRLLQPIPAAIQDGRNACLQLGQTLTLRFGSTEITGVAETLDERGHLHLRLSDGSVRQFASGETDFPA